MLMGILTLFMNLYAFWGHADPPQESYGGGRYVSSKAARDHRKDTADMDNYLGTGMSIDAYAGSFGIPAMNYMSNY